jgi:hypothetical protein
MIPHTSNYIWPGEQAMSTGISTSTAEQLHAVQISGQNSELLDIRTAAEYPADHVL